MNIMGTAGRQGGSLHIIAGRSWRPALGFWSCPAAGYAQAVLRPKSGQLAWSFVLLCLYEKLYDDVDL